MALVIVYPIGLDLVCLIRFTLFWRPFPISYWLVCESLQKFCSTVRCREYLLFPIIYQVNRAKVIALTNRRGVDGSWYDVDPSRDKVRHRHHNQHLPTPTLSPHPSSILFKFLPLPPRVKFLFTTRSPTCYRGHILKLELRKTIGALLL